MSILKRVLRVAAITLLLSVAIVGLEATSSTVAAITDQPPSFTLKWGSQSTADGDFTGPNDVATDSFGNVYVVDSGDNRIQKFDSNGTFITKWGLSGSTDGHFWYPEGIAIDSTNNVYVVDTANRRIQKFDSNGTFITKWGTTGSADGQFNMPSGIAIDAQDKIYIADTGNNRIQKFDSNGTFITKWGTTGSADSQFSNPYNVTAQGDRIYIADTGNNRIQKFDSNGTFITKWGTTGSADSQFSEPSGITSDVSGDIYVSDTGNNRIQKFDSNGTFITKWGTEGSADSQFQNQYGIDFYQDRTLYIADTGNNRIQKFMYPEVVPPDSSGDDPIVIPNATDGKSITMGAPSGTKLEQLKAIDPKTISPDNQNGRNYTYPLWLAAFTLNEVNIGGTVSVELFFETELMPDQVLPSKYNSSTSTYSELPGATVVASNLAGKTGLRLIYQIVDGGDLDQDSIANGEIVDPVGLAVKSNGQLANTGTVAIGLVATGVVLIALTAGYTFFDYKRHKRPLQQADPYLASSYTYLHHIRVVTVPALSYRFRIRLDVVEKVAIR
jgi:sugar lactone lactonase YvrE